MSFSLLLPARPHCWFTGLVLIPAWQAKTPRQPLAIQMCGTPSKRKQPKLWLPTHLCRKQVRDALGAYWVPARPKRLTGRGWPELGAVQGILWRWCWYSSLDIAMHRLRAKVDSCFTTATAHCGARRSCAGRQF